MSLFATQFRAFASSTIIIGVFGCSDPTSTPDDTPKFDFSPLFDIGTPATPTRAVDRPQMRVGGPAEAACDPYHVFVTNSGDNTVSVVSPATGSEIRIFATGARPVGIVVSRDGRRIVVANQRSNSVSIIDRLSQQEITRLPVAAQPTFAVRSNVTSLVYISSVSGRAVTVIDPNTASIVGTIPVTFEPYDLQEVGNRLFVVGQDPTVLATFDAVTLAFLGSFPITDFSTPQFLELNSANQTAYVTYFGLGEFRNEPGRLTSWNIVTGGLQLDIPMVWHAEDVRLHPVAPELLVLRHGSISSFDGWLDFFDDASLALTASTPLGQTPVWLGLTEDGAGAWVTEFTDGTVAEVDLPSRSVVRRVQVGTQPLVATPSPLPISVINALSTEVNTLIASGEIGSGASGLVAILDALAAAVDNDRPNVAALLNSFMASLNGLQQSGGLDPTIAQALVDAALLLQNTAC